MWSHERRRENDAKVAEIDQKWGDLPPGLCDVYEYTSSTNLCAWLRSKAHWALEVSTYLSSSVVTKFRPIPDPKDPKLISIYTDAKAAANDRRTSGKPGKIIRKMFPMICDLDLDKIVDEYKDCFTISADEYTLKVSKKADDFVHAYQHDQARFANLRTSSSRKSLACSCMRYKFEDQPIHPAAAYASGDFYIVWLEDTQGRIAGRCVVREDPAVHGPIYAVNELSADMIQEYVKGTLEAISGCDTFGGWEGARLVAHATDSDNDAFYAPYLDLGPQRLSFDGDHLVIEDGGDISGSDYNGILGVRRIPCENCGDQVDEYNAYYSSLEDCTYCERCYSEQFASCEREGDEFYRCDGSYVQVRGRFGIHTEFWGPEAVENHAVECLDGELWADEDVTFSANGEALSPVDTESGDWVHSDWDGELYPYDEMVNVEGECVHRDEVSLDEYTQDETTGEWRERDAA